MKLFKKIDELTDELQEQAGDVHNFKFDLWMIRTGFKMSIILLSISAILKILLLLRIGN